jgi:hypothetical protein
MKWFGVIQKKTTQLLVTLNLDGECNTLKPFIKIETPIK